MTNTITTRPKFSAEIIGKFLSEYYASSERTERIGQRWFNQMDNSGVPFPELFHNENPTDAIALIWKNYFKE